MNRKSTRPRRPLGLSAALGLTCLAAVAATALAADGDTERVSVGRGGAEGNGAAELASISADGRFVAFDSAADNLVADDTNDFVDVFVHDRLRGRTERVSVSSDGDEAVLPASAPSISAGGRYVAFHSRARNLADGDSNSLDDIFVHDRRIDVTERITTSNQAFGASGSTGASISANGRFVAFESVVNDLVDGDTNNAIDVFLHDRSTDDTERVSVDAGGAQANSGSFDPSISADGRVVVYLSNATNLVPNDTNDETDAFVHTRATGTARVSLSNGEAQADNLSFDPSISANGRLVAFSSSASNLVAGDTNDEGDAFVRDRAAATTVRISVSSAGAQANGQSFDSSISADGGRIAFSSSATNLDGGGAFTDVFIRDTREDSTNLVSESPGGAPGNGHSFPPSISADGCFLAFPSPATNLVAGDANGVSDIFVHDLPGCEAKR